MDETMRFAAPAAAEEETRQLNPLCTAVTTDAEGEQRQQQQQQVAELLSCCALFFGGILLVLVGMGVWKLCRQLATLQQGEERTNGRRNLVSCSSSSSSSRESDSWVSRIVKSPYKLFSGIQNIVWLSFKDDSPEEILEGAGLFCSLAPVTRALRTYGLWTTATSTAKTSSTLRLSCKPSSSSSSPRTSSAVSSSSSFWRWALSPRHNHHQHNSSNQNSNHQEGQCRDGRLPCSLPSDVQVHIMLFLHPSDVVTYGCVNRDCYRLVHQTHHEQQEHEETTSTTEKLKPNLASIALWRALWFRDYGWVMESWMVGKDALRRSGFQSLKHHLQTLAANHHMGRPTFSCEFYYRFVACHINYLLAGQNTMERCLMGLQGHIYDVTHFVTAHPGSPEVLLVQAGRDATAYFESIAHSRAARRFASSFCVLVNQNHRYSSSLSSSVTAANTSTVGCALRPTDRFSPSTSPQILKPIVRTHEHDGLPPIVHRPSVAMSSARKSARRSILSFLTFGYRPIRRRLQLQRIQKYLDQREKVAHQWASQRIADDPTLPTPLGETHVYYDPFLDTYKAWYTSIQLETIFLSSE